MRKFSYIFTLFATLLCGCNDNAIDSGDEQIVVPTKPYIYLDAAVNTRASLVEGTVLERKFGVYGFTYDFNNKWSTYRVTAKPNVFDDVPEAVSYSNGSYKYADIQEWQGGKYTFFAYYPYSLVVSGEEDEGTPYVTYGPDFGDTAEHRDVMTAMFEDTSLSSSPYVYFDFYHRLSAVDVVAMNFYEYSYDDPDAENTVITEKITIDIVDLALQFEGVQYQEAKIYLDRRIPSECVKADEGTNPFYQIISSGSGSGIYIDYNEDATLRPITEQNNSSMIFIPQENDNLKVTTTVKYKKRRPNGENIPVTKKVEKEGETVEEIVKDENGNIVYVFTQTIETPFNQPLKEGSRYFLQMTFTSSAVSISIITSDEWDDIKVDYEFE